MDSLVASYGSSSEEEEEEEEEEQQHHHHHHHVRIPSSNNITTTTTSTNSGFDSLPQPKKLSTLSFSLPPPKSELSIFHQTQNHSSSSSSSSSSILELQEKEDDYGEQIEERLSGNPNPKTSLFFSSIPGPKSNLSNPPQILTTNKDLSSSDYNLNKKRVVVVQLKKPSPIPKPLTDDDDDDDDDGELSQRRRRQTKEPPSAESESSLSLSSQTPPSVKSFLSSIPAPKNSLLGSLPPPSSSGSFRRSTIIDAPPPPPPPPEIVPTSTVSLNNEPASNYEENLAAFGRSSSSSAAVAAAAYSGYGALQAGQSGSVMTSGGGDDPSSWIQGNDNYGNYENYESYDTVEQQYENNWVDRSVTAMPGMTKTPFKRGRNEVPTDIVEVKQDELMKNRPREDQVKLTGIAFGPSYQPASTKGKPTKLHKRKHQIGSLYFDMKQKEMELSERRAKGFLTKAETHAKYGW